MIIICPMHWYWCATQTQSPLTPNKNVSIDFASFTPRQWRKLLLFSSFNSIESHRAICSANFNTFSHFTQFHSNSDLCIHSFCLVVSFYFRTKSTQVSLRHSLSECTLCVAIGVRQVSGIGWGILFGSTQKEDREKEKWNRKLFLVVKVDQLWELTGEISFDRFKWIWFVSVNDRTHQQTKQTNDPANNVQKIWKRSICIWNEFLAKTNNSNNDGRERRKM